MNRQLGLKRSFNYEDLASIVESSLTLDQCDDHSHHTEERRHKRIRTCGSSSSSFCSSNDEVSKKLDSTAHRSNTRLVSPTASRVIITPDSSPSIQSMTDSHASSFSLSSECPATAALNRSLISQRSSLSTDWDSVVYPLEEEKEECGDDLVAWPTIESLEPSPRSLDQFPVRRITLTSRTCSMRQDRLTEDVGKLQTAFSLLSLPKSKLESRKMSRLSSS
jgi:hypothetical protein